MAIVIGTSAAWREIADPLRSHGLDIELPSDINSLLIHLRKIYQLSVERKKSEIAQKVANKESRIATLRAEKGVWRKFRNWFRIWNCKMGIRKLYEEECNFIALLSENIKRLESLQGSPELAGAQTELDVISSLARLPAGYTVLNGLQLTADRFIRFNDSPLHSAQIDHVVLCSAGVFVIETKRWSKQFAESGEYHDPFDQVQRAAYLCYDQLLTEFGKIRVRSVIACAGWLPPPPQDSYVKVLPIPELTGYISWFKQEELSPELLLHVRRYLEKYVTT